MTSSVAHGAGTLCGFTPTALRLSKWILNNKEKVGVRAASSAEKNNCKCKEKPFFSLISNDIRSLTLTRDLAGWTNTKRESEDSAHRRDVNWGRNERKRKKKPWNDHKNRPSMLFWFICSGWDVVISFRRTFVCLHWNISDLKSHSWSLRLAQVCLFLSLTRPLSSSSPFTSTNEYCFFISLLELSCVNLSRWWWFFQTTLCRQALFGDFSTRGEKLKTEKKNF